MCFEFQQAIEVLRRTPNVLTAMLEGLSDPWITGNYGKDTFSPFDVVGHLIHGEKTDWMPRLRTILAHRESVPFEPFDRYAMYEASRGKSISALLREFSALREVNLAELESLQLSREQLDWRGVHPVLGAVTLRQLIATWVAHDLNHVHQIAKAMAYQYKEAVGPWRAHIGVLPQDPADGQG
ncbi:MAG: DinB family protein [Phycisphaerales bacterium]|nr:DinB family protein [Phycisphaerales bacterium]MCB9856568.1 DinB family protein [Phycisphaerales bacterium]MCB9864635.1 DinB family protein [Phycisphaerales bacterium]